MSSVEPSEAVKRICGEMAVGPLARRACLGVVCQRFDCCRCAGDASAVCCGVRIVSRLLSLVCSAVLVVLFVDSVERARYSDHCCAETRMCMLAKCAVLVAV